jgi:hypothetical protein
VTDTIPAKEPFNTEKMSKSNINYYNRGGERGGEKRKEKNTDGIPYFLYFAYITNRVVVHADEALIETFTATFPAVLILPTKYLKPSMFPVTP